MSKATKHVTKAEALKIVTHFIDRPGIIDLNVFMELLTWQSKLTLWVLQQQASAKG